MRRISGAGLATAVRASVSERVTECHPTPIYSDKHDAKHGARSGREQLPVRNEMTKPGASSFIVILERTGPVCERSGMERRRTFRAFNSSLAHSNNVDGSVHEVM